LSFGKQTKEWWLNIGIDIDVDMLVASDHCYVGEAQAIKRMTVNEGNISLFTANDKDQNMKML
jgi:hypothetical protein